MARKSNTIKESKSKLLIQAPNESYEGQYRTSIQTYDKSYMIHQVDNGCFDFALDASYKKGSTDTILEFVGNFDGMHMYSEGDDTNYQGAERFLVEQASSIALQGIDNMHPVMVYSPRKKRREGWDHFVNKREDSKSIWGVHIGNFDNDVLTIPCSLTKEDISHLESYYIGKNIATRPKTITGVGSRYKLKDLTTTIKKNGQDEMRAVFEKILEEKIKFTSPYLNRTNISEDSL